MQNQTINIGTAKKSSTKFETVKENQMEIPNHKTEKNTVIELKKKKKDRELNSRLDPTKRNIYGLNRGYLRSQKNM